MKKEKHISNRKAALAASRYRITQGVIAGILVLGVIMYMTGGLLVHHSSKKNAETIEAAISKIQAQEAAKPTDFSTRVLFHNNGLSVWEEEERIMALKGTEFSNATLTTWFDDCVIVGDSLVEGANLYEWLNPSIIRGEVGLSIASASELLDNAMNSLPSVIFMYFGTNDMNNFESRVEDFSGRYKQAIDRLQTFLPDTHIFVHAIFPEREDVIADKPYYKYRDDYNNALKELCNEMGVTYIDASFILERAPELFDEDGVHPTIDFYPLWFTYLADTAGLYDYEYENAIPDETE